jgi:hypothetical protein
MFTFPAYIFRRQRIEKVDIWKLGQNYVIMAAGALSEHLTCAVCLELFDDPRLLLCRHTFCRKCLISVSAGGREVKCPECRKPTPLGGDGVADLEKDFRLASIVDSYSRDLQQVPEIECTSVTCAFHHETLNLYCSTCMDLVCRKCLTDAHRGHEVVDTDDMYREQQVWHALVRPCIYSFTPRNYMLLLWWQRKYAQISQINMDIY